MITKRKSNVFLTAIFDSIGKNKRVVFKLSLDR